MADNSTFITGTAEGAFTAGFNELPAWATEDTLNSIKGILKKSFDVQSKTLQTLLKCACGEGGKSMSPDDAKKINDELERLGKNLKRTNEEDAKKRKRDKLRDKQEEDTLTRGKRLKTTEEKVTFVLTGLAAAGSKILGVNKDYINIYDSMYRSGLNVMNGNDSTADGFEALNQMVNLTGLRLETLQKVVEKYSNTVNAVGMAKFSKTLAMANTQLQALGYSSEQQAELIATLMESETGYTDIRKRTATQLSQDAVKLGTQLTKLSQTVGLSREQMQDNLKTNARAADSTMVAARFGEEAAMRVNQFVAGFKDQNLGKMFQQMAAATDPIFTQAYKDLQDSGLGVLANQLGQLAKDSKVLDPVESQRRLDSIINNLDQGIINGLQPLIDSGQSYARESLSLVAGLQQQGRNVSQATKEQQANATKTQASIAALKTEGERLAATLQKAFLPLIGIVDIFTKGLSILNNTIDYVINMFSAETRSLAGIGIIIAGFGSAIMGGMKIINAFTGLFGKGAGIIGKAVSGIGSAIGRIGGMLTRFAGPVAAIYAAFQLGTSIGETIYEMITGVEFAYDYIEIITGMFSDLSGWISGIFKGVKDSIGGVFGSIGGWFTDTFKGFQNAISSATDLVSNALSDIGNSLLKSLPILGTIGDYIMKGVDYFANIFNHVSMFVESFGDVLTGFLKSVASKFANKMSFGLFGSDESQVVKEEKSKVTKISVTTTPAPSTITSPSAIPAPSSAPEAARMQSNGDSSSSPAAAIERPARNADINKLLNHQGLLLEQILIGTNSLVDVNKDILRFSRNH